jgi:site-specific recombinase XerC
MPLERRCKNEKELPNWYYRFKCNGRVFKGTTGTTIRRDAEKIYRAKRAEVEAANPRRPVGGQIRLAELAGIEYEQTANGKVSPGTLRGLAYAWKQVVKHFGADFDPRGFTYDSLMKYVGVREGAGTSVRRELQAIKRALRIAKRKGWVVHTPTEWPKVKSTPKNKSQRGKLHDDAILKRWFAELTGRAYVTARVVLLTGLRSEELSRLTRSWIEHGGQGFGVAGFLRVPEWGSKDRDERIVGLVQEAYELLIVAADETDAELRGTSLKQESETPIFGKVDYKKSRIGAARRIRYNQNITLRDLRTIYLNYAVRGTGDPVAAQKAAGHSDLRTTEIYMRTTFAQQAAVSRAVAELAPRCPTEGASPDSDDVFGKKKVRDDGYLDGAKKETRTPDLLITNQLLYQLSYLGLAQASSKNHNACKDDYTSLAHRSIHQTSPLQSFTKRLSRHPSSIRRRCCCTILVSRKQHRRRYASGHHRTRRNPRPPLLVPRLGNRFHNTRRHKLKARHLIRRAWFTSREPQVFKRQLGQL